MGKPVPGRDSQEAIDAFGAASYLAAGLKQSDQDGNEDKLLKLLDYLCAVRGLLFLLKQPFISRVRHDVYLTESPFPFIWRLP